MRWGTPCHNLSVFDHRPTTEPRAVTSPGTEDDHTFGRCSGLRASRCYALVTLIGRPPRTVTGLEHPLPS